MLAACGGGGERQDADEPEGEFPVVVTNAQFPNRQRLAETTELKLGVENTGTEQIPEPRRDDLPRRRRGRRLLGRRRAGLVLDPHRAARPREPQPPRLDPREQVPAHRGRGRSRPARRPAPTAQTNTFAFGALAPGETQEMVWRLTAVRGGTYTVNYEIAAGLQGNAEAITADGSAAGGQVRGHDLDQAAGRDRRRPGQRRHRGVGPGASRSRSRCGAALAATGCGDSGDEATSTSAPPPAAEEPGGRRRRRRRGRRARRRDRRLRAARLRRPAAGRARRPLRRREDGPHRGSSATASRSPSRSSTSPAR